jgi:HEAT repeat protein
MLPGILAALVTAAGCAEMDEFSWRKMNFEVFREPENPMQVIRESKDGSVRARALRCLREPLANGGSQEDQDAVVAVLNYSASHESQPWCRIAAIDALRKFKDPRAAEGLKEAYYRAGSFTPDTATAIRCQALQGLGETGQSAAAEVLVRVLREPPVEGPDLDRDLKLRERNAAARALGNFKQYQATAALVEVLRTERDDALRDNAHQSLVQATGRDLPADAVVWANFLHSPDSLNAPPRQPHLGDKILQLTGLK